MSDFSTLSPLSDAELDAVTGGLSFHVRIDQNARGGDSVAIAGDGGNASAWILGTAIGGVGGAATSGPGGLGGTNTITVSV